MVWLILLLALLLLVAVLFVRYMTATHDTFQKMNIDSPPASWILGNCGQDFKQGVMINQTDLYNQFKDKKVYGVYRVRKPILVIRDLDMIKDIMVKSFNNFINRNDIFQYDAPLNQGLMFLKDDHWKNVRSALSPTFSSGRVKTMSQHVERNSQRLVDILRTKHERNENIDLKNITSNFTLDVIASTGFGLEINTMENPENSFASHVKKFMQPPQLIVVLNLFTPWLAKLLLKAGLSVVDYNSMSFFIKVVDSAIDNRKETRQAGKANDLLDLLINAENESEQSERRSLTRSEIHGQTLVIILGGSDTVATVLSFTLFLLANHPECCQMVQKEIDEKLGNESPNYDSVQPLTYLDMCINEAMRMFPPGIIIDRICTEDAIIQGIHIPKDMNIYVPVYAIHHDPEIWPEPEKFQPERFSPENKESRHPYAYLPFGHGPRNCIGMRLAIVELKLALAYVLKVLTPVPCEKTVYPVKLDKFLLKAVDGLWVRFEGRK